MGVSQPTVKQCLGVAFLVGALCLLMVIEGRDASCGRAVCLGPDGNSFFVGIWIFAALTAFSLVYAILRATWLRRDFPENK